MKKIMQNKLKQFTALFLVAVFMLGFAEPCLAEIRDENTIYIDSAEDLTELAKNCSYDKWSIGKTVLLMNDISLKEITFEPIPYFSGTFDGQGYTILDLELDGSYSPAGLFGITGPNSVIKNLKVSGSVIPEGEKEAIGGVVGINGGILQNVSFSGVVSGEVAVGGIAGTNKETGIIEGSDVKGSVFGEHGTGGIAGRNLGKILNCENKAYVNHSSGDSSVSLEDINTNLVQTLYSLNSSDVMQSFTDTGGIAGYSSGIILLSKNEGTVGYPRVGYNAGGIIGRSCGYIQGCVNAGTILGRKDVGGIAGHVEPFLDVQVKESDLVKVDAQLKDLKSQVDSAIANIDDTNNEVRVRLEKVSTKYIDPTIENVEDLMKNAQQSEIERPQDIELPSREEVAQSNREAVEEITTALKDINQEVSLAGKAAVNGTEKAARDLEDINSRLNSLSDSVVTMVDNMQNFTPEDILADTSAVNIDAVTYGKMIDCLNEGCVESDLNAGGIAGIMSIESELDPEDDTMPEFSWEEQKQYEVKAILINCTNQGDVTAKKDYAAGICAQADLGYITHCFAYGNIASESGDYVGGIAGTAYIPIADSIVKCSLSGKNYVGGILGCGFMEEENSSMVSDCYSMVEISDCEQFAGAVAGCDKGMFANNYFVSNELQGINRVSYENMAQPISYEELLQISGIPNELKSFTLSFVAEDKVIKTVEFDYGDSFGEEVIPQVPKKEGYDGQWNKTDFTNLCFDTVVEAEYTSYVTALESEAVRENERPVFLVEGDFSGEDTFTAKQEELTQEIRDEFSIKGKVAEHWKISFPDDGKKRHNVRFLPAEYFENVKLYVKENGEWTRVEAGEFGSYRTFQIAGNETELVTVSIKQDMILSMFGVMFLLLGVMCLVRLEKTKHFFSGIFKRVSKKFSLKKLMITLIICGIAAGAVVMASVFVVPKAKINVELAVLSKEMLSIKNPSMKLKLVTDIGNNRMELDSDVFLLHEEDTFIIVVEENERRIYMTPDAVFLENGKGYGIGEETENDLFTLVKKLYEVTEVEKTETQDEVIYSITADDTGAKELLTLLAPSVKGKIAEFGETAVHMITKEGTLHSVEIEGAASLKDAMETEMKISAVITDIGEAESGVCEISDELLEKIRNTDVQNLTNMEEEMYYLLSAWLELDMSKQEGIVSLDVSCGPINLETEHDWQDILNGVSEIQNKAGIEKIPDIIYEICMNGEFSSEKQGESRCYKLELDDTDMKRLAEIIAPEIQTQTVTLTDGIAEIMVKDNEICSFKIEIDGTVEVLGTEVDASVDAAVVFE